MRPFGLGMIETELRCFQFFLRKGDVCASACAKSRSSSVAVLTGRTKGGKIRPIVEALDGER
jgi:hypothetical protein